MGTGVTNPKNKKISHTKPVTAITPDGLLFSGATTMRQVTTNYKGIKVTCPDVETLRITIGRLIAAGGLIAGFAGVDAACQYIERLL